MDSFWIFSTVALFAFGTVWCFEWETQPEPVVYSCAGDKVTFPWRFKAGDAELIRDIRWYFDGDFDSTLVGTETSGYFFPTPHYSQRVRQLTNGGLALSDVTLSDAANYTVEVNLDSEGSALSHRHSVILQVGEGLMTQDRTLTVKQDPTALWVNSTQQWVIRLTCGLFTFLGQPPIRVTWITPALKTMSSSGYDNGNFYLTLPSPVAGGNYTCNIPRHFLPDVCVEDGNHENNTVISSVLVDEVKARLSLLEAENRQVKDQLRDMIHEHDEGISNLPHYVNVKDSKHENFAVTSSVLVDEVKARLYLVEAENRELQEQLRDRIQEHDEGISNLTHYVNEQLEAFRNEVHSLRNISREHQSILLVISRQEPCFLPNHVVLSDARRAVTNFVNDGLCDKTLTPGWYRFVLDGTNAVIPTECVPRYHCGTNAPYWLDLQGKALPGAGQQTDARACAFCVTGCHWETPITVRNCGAFFVYKLKPYDGCPLSFCAKKVDS
uniref:VIgL family ZP-related protein 1 isoform 1 n=1 Tax=Littorina littorea TaxID=31216 RepID=A0A411DEM4_LITLI|nr:VIgL family ZP-related protein 1 isoform 1 [Littorina littorea]